MTKRRKPPVKQSFLKSLHMLDTHSISINFQSHSHLSGIINDFVARDREASKYIFEKEMAVVGNHAANGHGACPGQMKTYLGIQGAGGNVLRAGI